MNSVWANVRRMSIRGNQLRSNSKSRAASCWLFQNKCGPGQPPGPHLVLADIPLALPRAGRGQRIACLRSEEHRIANTPGRTDQRRLLSAIRLQHYGGQRPVLPFVEDPSEEAATPGQPSRIHFPQVRLTEANCNREPERVSGEPSQRFTLENRRDPLALP